MGELIELKRRVQKTDENLIVLEPWEFRKACWKTGYFIQVLRSERGSFESLRGETENRGLKRSHSLPSYFSLEGAIDYTIRALWAYRKDEKRMREAYFLAGLIDCIINQINPILRTDILRAMYKKIFSMKEELNMHWYGPIDHILLPIESRFYNKTEYRSSLADARTMKGLYQAIRRGTDEMFDILSSKYVFFCPGVGG